MFEPGRHSTERMWNMWKEWFIQPMPTFKKIYI